MPAKTPEIDIRENRIKNYLINGSFKYFQRGGISAPITINNTGYQTADRWSVHFNNTVTSPTSERGTALPPAFSGMSEMYNLRLNCTSGSSTGSGNLYTRQRIESIFTQDLVKNGKMSFSVQVGSQCAGRCRVIFYYPSAKDNFTSTTLFSDNATTLTTSANGLTYQEIKIENITVPSQVTNGLEIWILFDNWTVLNAASQAHRICAPMLNIGSTAQDFNHAATDIVSELRLCQRYYQKSFDLDTAPANGATTTTLSDGNGWRFAMGNSVSSMFLRFSIDMRANPTMTRFGNSAGQWLVSGTSNAAVTAGPNSAITGSLRTGFYFSQQDVATSVTTMVGHFTADAEL